MKVYYDKDANLDIVQGKKIAVIGYGSQGHAHANNLKESGMDVIVAEYPKGGENWTKAEKAGHTVMMTADAVKAASVIMILLPDEMQADIYNEQIAPNINPGSYVGFIILGLGIFSWIRSGSCFCGTPVRAVVAEVITVGGGAGLVALLGPGASVTWAISIWLFFLVQAVYFYLVPTSCAIDAGGTAADPFEQAHREALRVLDEAV